MPSAVIIGASIGGLVAAVQLREGGWDVTVLEKGGSLGGLYSTVDTPFGNCELGMHVLYVSAEQQALLEKLFGADAFIEKHGVEVDIGASFNQGTLNSDSIYPDVRGLAELPLIREQILQRTAQPCGGTASEALHGRFGAVAAEKVVAPILQKLWGQPADALAPGALHCFFDLRRIIVADKAEADSLKQDPLLDAVIGNPLQNHPAGAVYGGRRALFFSAAAHDLSQRALTYLQQAGIEVELGCDVRLDDYRLVRDGQPLGNRFEVCILATPLSALAPDVASRLDSVELSVSYFQVEPLDLPAYYVLCHSSDLAASRIVNYGAYNFDHVPHRDRLLAVEALHEVGNPPSIEQLRAELQQVLPDVQVIDSHAFPRRLRVAAPTLANAVILDELAQRVTDASAFQVLHFTGMRTDQGVFFSHQTVGGAHAAALACSRR